MLLETLNALNEAGTEALQSSAGLKVNGWDISLVREGQQVYPCLATLRIKGSSLQIVHFGCDDQLAAHLSLPHGAAETGTGWDSLTSDFLSRLLGKLDDRNPRGSVDDLGLAPPALHTRGVRTFQFRLDTGQGQLFLLAEVPSRTEMSIAQGSEYLASMESIYLPENWRSSQEAEDPEVVASLLTFLWKTEADIYLETPAGDGTATINSGLFIENTTFEGRPALKFIIDFSDPALGVPVPGATVSACVGIDDRSLEFEMKYLGPAAHAMTEAAKVPGALFSPPGHVTIGQRRRTFRVPVSEAVKVEMEPASGQGGASPWADESKESGIVTGRLADLSFSGARIIADHAELCSCFSRDCRIVCRMYFPEVESPLQVMGVIRRSTAGPADRNHWQDEIGLEFLVSPDCDRAALDYIRQFVLQTQRMKLAQRLQVTGV